MRRDTLFLRLDLSCFHFVPSFDRVIHIGAAQGNKGGAAVGLAALLAIGQGLKAAFQENTGRRIMLSAWAESHQGFIGSTEFTEVRYAAHLS